MDFGLIVHVIWAFGVVALLLFGLWWVVRTLGRGRMIATADRRLTSVIESTFLSQNTTIHVVKVADRYYLVGGGSGHLSLLGEVPAETVTAWIETQRRSLVTDRDTLVAFLQRFKNPRE